MLNGKSSAVSVVQCPNSPHVVLVFSEKLFSFDPCLEAERKSMHSKAPRLGGPEFP